MNRETFEQRIFTLEEKLDVLINKIDKIEYESIKLSYHVDSFNLIISKIKHRYNLIRDSVYNSLSEIVPETVKEMFKKSHKKD